MDIAICMHRARGQNCQADLERFRQFQNKRQHAPETQTLVYRRRDVNARTTDAHIHRRRRELIIENRSRTESRNDSFLARNEILARDVRTLFIYEKKTKKPRTSYPNVSRINFRKIHSLQRNIDFFGSIKT